jgi:hypothetical protein
MSAISDCPILIYDENIAFSRNVSKYNGNFYRINVTSLINAFGFLVPLNISSFDFVTYFEDGPAAIESGERHSKALLIDHHARVYELAMTLDPEGELIVSKMRICTGFGTRYAKGSVPSEEDKGMVALDISPSLEEAVKVLAPNLYAAHSDYTVLSIASIAEGLKKINCTKPFPVNRKVSAKALAIPTWSPALSDVDLNEK